MSSITEVTNKGWVVADGWQCGGTNPKTGQVPIGSAKNVAMVKGKGLVLTVPRQSSTAKILSVAEVQFPQAMLGGVLEVEAQLTAVPGTCMGIFTSHADSGLDQPLGWQDEHDIEMLSTSLFKQVGGQPAGISMVFYEPKYVQIGLVLERYLVGGLSLLTMFDVRSDSDGRKSYTNQGFPAGVDPTKGFHTYSISWFPTTSNSNPARMTEIRFDGKLQNAPKIFSSIHPSSLVLNHWTNADSAWSGGPPTENSALIMKRVVAYYDRSVSIAAGAQVSKNTACTRAKACQITI
ncbi:hypothetical protein QFC19_003659 [Naganishia cerealis]|uniref:Uncharacterized protein n=1 Tax=Naganishia cerealis TaxID=610337 RepID=A0ACC2W0Q8_9TREE|nr:hypothetical protein QFC19_003659 [Naganishia cerealis]